MGDKLSFLFDSEGGLKGLMVEGSAGKQVYKLGTKEGELDSANLLKLAQQKLREPGIEYGSTRIEDARGNRNPSNMSLEAVQKTVGNQIKELSSSFLQQASTLENNDQPRLAEYFKSLSGNLKNPNQPSILNNALMANAESVPARPIESGAASYTLEERKSFKQSYDQAKGSDGISPAQAAALATKLTDFVLSSGTSTSVYSDAKLAEKATKQVD